MLEVTHPRVLDRRRLVLAAALLAVLAVPAWAAIHRAIPANAPPEKRAAVEAAQRGQHVGPLVAQRVGQQVYATSSAGGSQTIELASQDSSAVTTFPAPVPAIALAGQDSPRVVYGRVTAPAARFEVRFPDGERVSVPLTHGGFFVLELPAGERAAAEAVAVSASGAIVARKPLPPVASE